MANDDQDRELFKAQLAAELNKQKAELEGQLEAYKTQSAAFVSSNVMGYQFSLA